MKEDMLALVHGYLDGILTEEQEAALNAWVESGPANARQFAAVVRLHDHLHNVFQARHRIALEPNEAGAGTRWPDLARPRHHWRRMTIVGGLTVLAATLFLVVWWQTPNPVSAATELDGLIARAADARDRSYVIRNLDSWPEQPDERRPPIDGAILYVRNPDQYVLRRQFPDGRPFVTGSDGEQSWSIAPDGPVRVSGDPLRFRGPVPGNQHGIPFVNLRSDLLQLRDAYNVSVLDARPNNWRGLLAEKKSAEFRGPRQIELWYEPSTRVIQRMVFEGMPRARGGPDSVAVELREQRDLGPDLFRHEAHHAPDRRVILEDFFPR